jgi:IS5 family transposase
LLPKEVLGGGLRRNRVRSARWIRQWSRSTPKQERHRQARQGAITHLYGELIQIASTTLDQAAQAALPLQEQKSDRVGTRLLAQLIQLQPLIKKVIEQARRRVLQGETVPAQEKVASLWELHTQIIRRGKPPPHETEFGHKVDSAEVEHGLISDWQVIARGNPPDAERLPPLLK